MPYRVLMIAPTSFFLDYGAHVRIREEAHILQQLGHHVKIVTYPIGRDLPGFDIERTLPIPFHSHHEVGPSRSKLIIDVLLAIKSLQTTLAFRPNVIHAHLHEGALIGGILSRLLHVPLVFDFQGSLTSEMVDHQFIAGQGVLFKLLHWLELRIDRLPRHILTSSQNAANLLTNQVHIPANKVTVLQDCVQLDTFLPIGDAAAAQSEDELRAQLNIPRGRRIIIYIGLLDEYRGTRMLLQAAQQLLQRGRDLHFVVIGFPNIERYQSMARELGIADRMVFPGRVPYEDVPRWLALGDVAVEPKMSATEAAGKVLNYMAMGLPVVAFDIPVMHEYLGEYGVFAPLGDAARFANEIEKLLDDPQRARTIGLALRDRARQLFSWEQAGRTIERVYESVLE